MKDNTIDIINQLSEEIEEQGTTFYTAEGIHEVPAGGSVMLYSTYEELCEEWLNTGVSASDEAYRNHTNKEQEEADKQEYFDYKKGIWFALNY